GAKSGIDDAATGSRGRQGNWRYHQVGVSQPVEGCRGQRNGGSIGSHGGAASWLQATARNSRMQVRVAGNRMGVDRFKVASRQSFETAVCRVKAAASIKMFLPAEVPKVGES